MSEKSTTLKQKVFYWRKRRAMSIRDLVKASGVSSATIGKAEKDPGYLPIPDVLNRLAKALNVSMDELVVDDEEERKPRPAA